MDRKKQIQEAKALKANLLLPEILQQLRDDTIPAWEGATTAEMRERCWTSLHAVERLREELDARISGILAGDGGGGGDAT